MFFATIGLMTDNQDLSFAVSAVNAVGAVRPAESLMAVSGTNGGLDAPNVCRDFLRKRQSLQVCAS